ncbi:MAG TPA: YceI family protein [Acidimicrobiales bacterium]|nr:YceI family protein [Acidimicrobiales bacterium]
MRYDIDPERSQVWISARSNVHPIHSETRGMTGFVDVEVSCAGRLDMRVPPQARLELPVDRLSSGNPLNDREMRRRIDARRFPTITGELLSMKEAGRPAAYLAEGDITFRGMTQRFADELTVAVAPDGTLVFEGEHVFDIRDFGMDPPRVLVLKVYPDVTVRVRVVAEAR